MGAHRHPMGVDVHPIEYALFRGSNETRMVPIGTHSNMSRAASWWNRCMWTRTAPFGFFQRSGSLLLPWLGCCDNPLADLCDAIACEDASRLGGETERSRLWMLPL